MRRLVSLIMYMNNIFFLIIVVPLINITVTGLNSFRHQSLNPYYSYSFQQTDSRNNESEKPQKEANKSEKTQSDNSNDDVGSKSSTPVQNSSNSDSSESTSEKSNDESKEQGVNESNDNVDKSQNNNESDENSDQSTGSTSEESNKSTDNLLNNVILNPSVKNVDFTIKTLRNETGDAINSFKHVCTLVQELISIMPQNIKNAEIELYTKKIITSELYNECVKHLTTLEAFENDLDKFATQAQISLIYSHPA